MAGNLYGPDQIKKINALYPALLSHLRSLLAADHTGVGLMKVHVQVESFDSDEMANIFRQLSFVSPLEKKALVRAALYQLMVTEPALFVAPAPFAMPTPVTPFTPAEREEIRKKFEEPKAFTPPQFSLNINSADKFHGQKPADVNVAQPTVTSTHTPKAAEMLKKGAKEATGAQDAREEAVAKVRATPAVEMYPEKKAPEAKE